MRGLRSALVLLLLLGGMFRGLAGQVVEASRLSEAVSLETPWRFHAGDGADFSASGFDDSSWSLMAPAQRWDASTVGPVWLRLRVEHIRAPLGVVVATTSALPYEVYANGTLIAKSPTRFYGVGMAANSFVIPLPAGENVVIALRIRIRPDATLTTLPLDGLLIGPLQAVGDRLNVARLRTFNDHALVEVVSGLLYLGLGFIAFTLFRAQRNHPEYFWLGLMGVTTWSFFEMDAVLDISAIPSNGSTLLVYRILGWLLIIVSMEFVARFSGAKLRVLHRIEVVALIGPFVANIAGAKPYYEALILMLLVWTYSVTYFLMKAYRRGREESGLLIAPFALFGFINMLAYGSQAFSKMFPFPSRFQLGYVAVGLDDVGGIFVLGGLFAVVLSRFLRVNREQQRADAELEAARSVQQVLIPNELPRIAGFQVSSVYKPAQQVGGDFFQIIHAEDDAVLVVLGDVAGKGLQAAMTVSLLVGTVQTEAEHTSSPMRLMQMLNRRSHGRGSSFTTCLIMHVTRTGQVTAANAGHLHPYLGGQELAIEAGLPLGFDVDAEYGETCFQLAPGETLTLVTDGVVEAVNVRKELFGFARTEAISTMSALDIASAAERFAAPAPQADDITVLTLTRTA